VYLFPIKKTQPKTEKKLKTDKFAGELKAADQEGTILAGGF